MLPARYAPRQSDRIPGECQQNEYRQYLRGVPRTVRACETVIMRPIVQSTFAARWSAVLVVWAAASVEAAHEREAIPQPSRRGG